VCAAKFIVSSIITMKNFEFRESLFRTKSLIMVLSIITLLFFSSILYASDNAYQSEFSKSDSIAQSNRKNVSILDKSYNTFYQFINDHERLIAPLSGVMTGYVVCGPWCAIAGGVTGTIDEVAIFFGVMDKHYLTWGTFGLATGHVINPSLESHVLGVIVGILLPTGALNDHQELIAPTISAIAGYSMTGISGAISGGLAGVIDDVNIQNDLVDKHYMTFSTVGMAITHLLGWFNPIVTDSVGVFFGLILSNYEDKIFIVWIPVTVTKDLYTTYNNLLPEGQLESHIEKQALALIGSQFIVRLLGLRLDKYEDGLRYNFERFDTINGLEWRRFQLQFVSFAVFIFPYVAGQAFSNFINDYFSAGLNFALEDKLYSEWLAGETALRLSHSDDASMLINNLKTDISTVVNLGSELITSAVSVSMQGVYSLGVIIAGSPSILVYSTAYSQLCSLVSEYLAKQQKGCEEQIKFYEHNLANIIQHDNKNIELITERDGLEFTQKKLQKIYAVLREYEVSKRMWKEAGNVWRSSSDITDFMFNYYLVGYKINLGALPFESRNNIRVASYQMSSLSSWTGKHAVEMSTMYQSLNRINVLMGKIKTESSGADQITRIFKTGDQLVLHDLEINAEEKNLFVADHLELQMGNAYAITGVSGSGKTSFLSKIKGIKENGISGSGYVYYPMINDKEAKIVMVNQRDYFPVDSSLLEIIYYPNEISDDPILRDKNTEEAQAILEELGFNVFNSPIAGSEGDINDNQMQRALALDDIKDWYGLLSGGEKKKILIASAIIKNPDILLLDEVFAGLDSESIILIQQMLKKYLPHALILVVDHHAQDNNNDFFYDGELHFSSASKRIVFQEIVSR
jgi:ABC-type uncharacterized transport system fused permease/ATPase subunit